MSGSRGPGLFAFVLALASCAAVRTAKSWELSGADLGGGEPIRLTWSDDLLRIQRSDLPGGQVEIWYLEAYCRSGSTDRDWHETVIRHSTELLEADARRIRLRCRLPIGEREPYVTVEHEITASGDEVAFWVRATNEGSQYLDAQWVQPCMRVHDFTGRSQQTYQERSFVFTRDGLTLLSDLPRALEAHYTHGQVFVPRGIERDDVNPRPISEVVPANGLVGCFSADGSQLLATAWEPYQELFQGVIVCLHSDFRLGGLAPGQTRVARGKVYLLRGRPDGHSRDALVEDLLARYRRDFPDGHGR